MMKIRKGMLLAAALLLASNISSAQEADNRQIKEEGKTVFSPHWFMQVQGGIGHTLGEGDFGKLFSPAAALNIGYQFNPVFGLRAGISGWQAKGAWVSPEQDYKYKFVQGNVDAVFNLTNVFGGFDPSRTYTIYAFAGAAFNHAFDNDEAVAIANKGYNLRYLWSDSKNFLAGRAGLGVGIRLSDYVDLNVEANANMLSDKFNSKKAGNVDWHFNGLVGLTIRLGKSYTKTEPVYYEPASVPAPVAVEQPKKEEPKPVVKEAKVEPMRCDIFFTINSSVIRADQQQKVADLVAYLKQHASAKVSIVGYADKATGTPSINSRLSKERAAAVAAALQKAGIAADRIATDAKGDTVQPFAVVEENRVSICIAE